MVEGLTTIESTSFASTEPCFWNCVYVSVFNPVRCNVFRGLSEGLFLHATSDGNLICKTAFSSVPTALSFSCVLCMIRETLAAKSVRVSSGTSLKWDRPWSCHLPEDPSKSSIFSFMHAVPPADLKIVEQLWLVFMRSIALRSCSSWLLMFTCALSLIKVSSLSPDCLVLSPTGCSSSLFTGCSLRYSRDTRLRHPMYSQPAAFRHCVHNLLLLSETQIRYIPPG